MLVFLVPQIEEKFEKENNIVVIELVKNDQRIAHDSQRN